MKVGWPFRSLDSTRRDRTLNNELYLLIGALIGFIYTLAAAAIVISLTRKREPRGTTLGDLRSLLSKAQEEIQEAQKQVWIYGTGEEEKTRRWRMACTTVASKAADALQSCWLGREKDSTANAIYDELLTGLKSVGLEEIKPSVGQEVEENDSRYRINHKEGVPPYKLSRLVCPGYYFRLGPSRTGNGEQILIQPAQVEVAGEKSGQTGP